MQDNYLVKLPLFIHCFVFFVATYCIRSSSSGNSTVVDVVAVEAAIVCVSVRPYVAQCDWEKQYFTPVFVFTNILWK